jgi:hypothetical protein
MSLEKDQRLSWDDLQTDVTDINLAEVYGLWPGMEKHKAIRPNFITAFGNMFFMSADDRVYQINTLALELENMNMNAEQFKNFINEENVINEELMSWLVYKLKYKKKLIRGKGQVYAFTPHPIWGAEISENNIMIMNLRIWINLCIQMTLKPET